MTLNKQRTRLSIDISPEEERQIYLAAALHDRSVQKYVLGDIHERLARDIKAVDQDGLLTLTAKTDPLLAQLWDNEKDAAYDRL